MSGLRSSLSLSRADSESRQVLVREIGIAWFHPESSIFHCDTRNEGKLTDDGGGFDPWWQREL